MLFERRLKMIAMSGDSPIRITCSFEPHVRRRITWNWEPLLHRPVINGKSYSGNFSAGMSCIYMRADFFQADSAAGLEVPVQHTGHAYVGDNVGGIVRTLLLLAAAQEIRNTGFRLAGGQRLMITHLAPPVRRRSDVPGRQFRRGDRPRAAAVRPAPARYRQLAGPRPRWRPRDLEAERVSLKPLRFRCFV